MYGVRGGLRVYSYTEPRENIVRYSPWHVRTGAGWQEMAVRDGRAHGKGVVVWLEGCTDRDAAAQLVGADVAVRRSQLPELPAGEYYWTDLIGLRVTSQSGAPLGIVVSLMETAAHDVLVVASDGQERLIPFVMGRVVQDIDLAAGAMTVDWEPDY